MIKVLSSLSLLILIPVLLTAEEKKPYRFPKVPDFAWSDQLKCTARGEPYQSCHPEFRVDEESGQEFEETVCEEKVLWEVKLSVTYRPVQKKRKPREPWSNRVRLENGKGTYWFNERLEAILVCDEWMKSLNKRAKGENQQ